MERSPLTGLAVHPMIERARIALIRKLCGIMRRMLLNKEEFRHINLALYEKKRKDYKKQSMEIKEEIERKSALVSRVY